MAVAKINKRNNAILIGFFVIMYTIFGLLYTKTGNEILARDFGIESMPNAGISPVHFEEADRNEVITSLRNVNLSDVNHGKMFSNYYVDLSDVDYDHEDEVDEFAPKSKWMQERLPPPGYERPEPTTKPPKTTKAPRVTADPLVFKPDKSRLKANFLKSKDYEVRLENFEKKSENFVFFLA